MKDKTTHSPGTLQPDDIMQSIMFIRGKRVMIDSDLAQLYKTTTKRLNEQVKRNSERFPGDFMFQLTPCERDELVANCDRLHRLKHSSTLPFAFTEHGALMLANVLRSEQAVHASILIIRAFIRMRSLLESHQELARKIDEMERAYESRFRLIFELLRQLTTVPSRPQKQIGFSIPPKTKPADQP